MKWAIKMCMADTYWLRTMPDGACVWTVKKRLRSWTADRNRAVDTLNTLRKSGYLHLKLVRIGGAK